MPHRGARERGSGGVTAGSLALRHDPDHHGRAFPRRHDNALPFDPVALPGDLPLMLDTTVYVHRLQNKAHQRSTPWSRLGRSSIAP
jgi:hypothetical protein